MTVAANILQIPSTPEKDLSDKASNLIAQADRCTVVDDATCERATDLAKMLSGLSRKLEEHRKEITQPINEALRTINARYKKPSEALDAAVRKVKASILAYTQKKQAEERVRLAAAREQELAALVAAKVDAETEADVVEKLADAERRAETARPAIVRGDLGSAASIRKTWTFELTDFAALPDDYKLPNETKIREFIRAGGRELAGVRIFEREDVAIR